MFDRDSAGVWRWSQTIRPKEPDTGALFGYRVALSEKHALIFNNYKLDSTIKVPGVGKYRNSICAYKRELNGVWSNIIELRNPGIRSSDTLAFNGPFVLDGANVAVQVISERRIYFYDLEDSSTFSSPKNFRIERAGTAMVYEGDRLMIGAYDVQFSVSPWPSDYGAVFDYRRNQRGEWVKVDTLIPPKKWAGSGPGYGWAMDLNGDDLIVGAPYDDTWLDDGTRIYGAGAAYVLNLCKSIDTSVVVSDGKIKAVDTTGSDYDWLDCWSDFSPIDGENSYWFIPKEYGKYAAVIKHGNCYDTSSCRYVLPNGVSNAESVANFKLFPNPVNAYETFHIQTNETVGLLEVMDPTGRVLMTETFVDGYPKSLRAPRNPGVYVLRFTLVNGGSAHGQLVVK